MIKSIFSRNAHTSSSHAPRGNSVVDALRPELGNTDNGIGNSVVPCDAERRDMHSHAERGNEVNHSINKCGRTS